MTPEAIACTICGAKRVEILGVHPDFLESEIAYCRRCRFMFTHPEPDEDTLAATYVSTYREVLRETPTDDYIDFMDSRGIAQWAFIEDHFALPTGELSVLDIGCGIGGFLKGAPANAGRLVGFEPDQTISELARLRLAGRAEIVNSVFVPREWREERFDVIAMSHVLEHIPRFSAFLRDVMRHLNLRGCLFLEVPHESRATVTAQITAQFRGKMHLSFFDVNTLRQGIVATGAAAICVQPFGPSFKELTPVPLVNRNRSTWTRLARKVRRRLLVPPAASVRRDLTSQLGIATADGGWLRAIAGHAPGR